jgi:hypothetical protein
MMFRKHSFRIALLVLLGATASCEETLDLKPVNSLETDQVFVDLAGANAAVIGTYGNLNNANYYGLRYAVFADLAADNLAHIGTFPTFAEIKNRNIQPQSVDVTNMWAALYAGVNRANNVIANVPTINAVPLSDRRRLVAEAQFLRAHNYFNLVRYWGDVPLVLTPTTVADNTLNVARTPSEEVYNQVRADLDSAELYLPAQNLGRATVWATRALKARLALYRGEWADAERFADQVIASPLFSLQASYRAIWDNKNTSESIFEVQFDNTNQSQYAFFFLPQSQGGRNEVSPTGPGSTLPTAYETGDTRRPASISDGTFRINGRNVPTGTGIKYIDAGTGTDNYRAIRLAEMILTSAEAKAQQNELDDALVLLNRIRTRAGLPALVALSQSALLDAIYQERRVELAMEGHRWFDLIRTGRAQSVLNIADPRRLLFPIPFRETVNNPNMVQNPGY